MYAAAANQIAEMCTVHIRRFPYTINQAQVSGHVALWEYTERTRTHDINTHCEALPSLEWPAKIAATTLHFLGLAPIVAIV